MNRLEKIKAQHESTGFVLGEDITWLIGRVGDLESLVEDIKELVPDLTIFECRSTD